MRHANVRPIAAEHEAVCTILANYDPAGARAMMRARLIGVMDHLLFTTEERAIEEARHAVAKNARAFSPSSKA